MKKKYLHGPIKIEIRVWAQFSTVVSIPINSDFAIVVFFLFHHISGVNKGKCLDFISFYRIIPRLLNKTKVWNLSSHFVLIRRFFPQGGLFSKNETRLHGWEPLTMEYKKNKFIEFLEVSMIVSFMKFHEKQLWNFASLLPRLSSTFA